MNARSVQWRHGETGLALVSVLWAIVLLTIMAGSFSLSLQRDTNLVKFNEDRARGAALADAAVHYAMLKVSAPATSVPQGLQQTPQQGKWRTDGFPCPVQLPDGEAVVQIFDEGGKVNLNMLANAAGYPVLRTVLAQVFDGDQERADSYADAIIDWVDPDQFSRPLGAEAGEYERANKGYVPPDREFQALEELLMVIVNKETGETLSPKMYRKLEPILTIYPTATAGVNIGKASRAALTALPLQCMEASAAAQHWQMRGNSCFELPLAQQQVMPVVQAPAGMQLPGRVTCAQGNSPGQVFTIYASSKTSEGQTTSVKAVVARRPNQVNNGSPFTFLSWKQLPSALADGAEQMQMFPSP
jgi:general secretion pathway protein K